MVVNVVPLSCHRDPPLTGDRQSDSLVLLPSLGEDEDEESAETSTNCLKRSLVVEEDIGGTHPSSYRGCQTTCCSSNNLQICICQGLRQVVTMF